MRIVANTVTFPTDPEAAPDSHTKQRTARMNISPAEIATRAGATKLICAAPRHRHAISRGLTPAATRHNLRFAVQAAPGPAGRVEPTCSFQTALRAFVQPVLRAVGDLMHGGLP